MSYPSFSTPQSRSGGRTQKDALAMAGILSPVHACLSSSCLVSSPQSEKHALSMSPVTAEAAHYLRAAGGRQSRTSSSPRGTSPWKRKITPASPSRRPDRGPVPEPSRPGKMTGNVNVEVSPHRAVAAVRLLRVEQGGAFVDLLNEKGKHSAANEMDYVERTLGFRTRDLENRDIRLVTEVVGGTVRWKRYLDHLILSLCNEEKIFRGMEPLLLQILRISFYEIVKLGVPPYAVVYENVKLAKVALRPGAGNFVNGLLRKLILTMETETLLLPKVEGDDRAQARALATIYSHPVWMVRRWLKYLGPEETVKLMNWNNSEPTYSLRVNSAIGLTREDLIMQLNTLNVPFEPSSHIDDFVRVKTGMQIVILSGLIKEGICSVQDESAGMVVQLLHPQPGESIVDCCAAPGGKTLYIASLLKGQGAVCAIDINKGRLRVLEEAAKLHNVNKIIRTVHADLRAFVEVNTVRWDKVLLDAPCSGLGVLSKRADLRWNRRLEEMEELKSLQDELLDAASMLVNPGGVLVYSTCSIDPDENEARIEAFVERNPEFSVESAARYVPPDFVTDKGFYFSNPVKHSLDGSFAARLVRSAKDSV